MNAAESTAEYFRLRERYLDIQALENFDERAAAMGKLTEEQQRCFRELSVLSETGGPEVWYALGDACQSGRGTVLDYKAAIRWHHRAAETGHLKAMVSLGLCLRRSESPEEKKNALHWFHEAAAGGDASAMTWLGFCYRDGHGVEPDDHNAIHWFAKAVEAGDAHSMVYLGRLYCCRNQPALARQWLSRAALAGFADSHVHLAMLLDDRETDVYCPQEAVIWWLLIAQRKGGSNLRAMVALARHLRDGIGVERDVRAGKEWLRKCIQEGSPRSEFHREAEKLLKEMDGDLL